MSEEYKISFKLPTTSNNILFDVADHREKIVDDLINSRFFNEFSAESYADKLIDEGASDIADLDKKINALINSKKKPSDRIDNKMTLGNFALNKKQSSSDLFKKDTGITEEEDYFVFLPSKRDMKTDYPELARVIEFKDLTNKEMVFVWFHSNQTSPYFEMEAKHKTALSIKEAWGDKLTREDIDAYLDGNFPEKIRLALERMKKYKPSVRMKALMMQEKTMADYQIILAKNISGLEPKAQSDYIDMINKINKALPELINSIEEGFGIKIRSGKDFVTENEMDTILQEDEKSTYDL